MAKPSVHRRTKTQRGKNHFESVSVLAISMVVVTAIGLPGRANASPVTGVEAPSEVGEVIVTAEKRASKIMDSPISISAVSGSQLTSTGNKSLADLQQIVPGLSVSSTNVLIRGIGSNTLTADASPGVALHLDGVYLGRQYAVLDTFFDTDRIEVLRGPQGTLYGRNATGGVINIITAKPTSTAQGYLDVTGGNYDAKDVRGALGGPIGDGGIEARISLLYDGHDGTVTNIFPGAKPLDNRSEYAGRFQLHVPLGAAVNLDLALDSMRNDDRGLRTLWQSVPVVGSLLPSPALFGAVIPPLSRGVVNLDSPDSDHFRSSGISAKLTWEMAGATLSSLTAYRKTDFSTQNDFDGAQIPYGYLSKYIIDQEQFSEEVNLASKGGGPLTWVAGAYAYRETVNNPSESDLPLFALSAPAVANLTTDAYAVFGQATYKLGKAFDVTGGLRYSVDNKSLNQQGNEFGVPLSDDVSKSWDAVTGRATLDYHASDRWLMYATISNGFKSGGFNVGVPGALNFNPERVVNYELGTKGRAFDGRMTLEADVFRMDYTGLQVFSFTGISSVIRNAARSTINGVEAETRVLPLPDHNLEVDVGLAFLDAKYDHFVSHDDISNTTSDVGGNRLENTPPFKLDVQVHYRWVMSSGATISPFIGYSYQTRVFFRPQNDALFSQAPYGLVNASIEYISPNGHWNATLFGRNLANKSYAVGSSLITVSQVRSVNLGEPETWGVKLGYRF